MEKDYRYVKLKCTHCGHIERDVIVNVNDFPEIKCTKCNCIMLRVNVSTERKFKFEN